MVAIRSKDTKPEMIVRRGLWKRGFRYRLNHKRLPGHPDLVLFPYHYGQTDVSRIPALLKDDGVEVRIRHYE